MPPVSEGKAVRKYLSTHAEDEARSAELPAGTYDHAVVIPARGEGAELFRAIDHVPPSPGGVLILLVLNAGEGDAPERHAANARVRDAFAAANRIETRDAGDGRTLVVIDRSTPGRFLPAKQGVGLARKIGCDAALALHAAGRIRSRFLHTTDADAVLPVDAFERALEFHGPSPHDASRRRPTPAARGRSGDAGPVALLYPFAHEPAADPGAARAIVVYEAALRYHRLGLQAARSPFAFHTIGSTIAMDFVAYAAVRGFPRREAGEDFYLLDKLAKVGPVRTLGGAPVRISGRVSDRVPFGTGRTLLEFQRGDRTPEEYTVLDPACFAALGSVLDWLDGLSEVQAGTDLRAVLRGCLGADGRAGAVPAGRLDRTEGSDPGRPATADTAAAIVDVLDAMGAFTAAARFLDPALARVRRRSLHTWFDGFRTLRFLHDLRDHGRPALPLAEAVRRAPFLAGFDEAGDSSSPDAGTGDPGLLAALKGLDEGTGAGTSTWVGALRGAPHHDPASSGPLSTGHRERDPL